MRVLEPRFAANDVSPLFFAWKTGARDVQGRGVQAAAIDDAADSTGTFTHSLSLVDAVVIGVRRAALAGTTVASALSPGQAAAQPDVALAAQVTADGDAAMSSTVPSPF